MPDDVQVEDAQAFEFFGLKNDFQRRPEEDDTLNSISAVGYDPGFYNNFKEFMEEER